MSRTLRRTLMIVVLLLQATFSMAQEGTQTPPGTRPIPYRTDPTPIEEQGPRTALVFVLLMIAFGTGLYIVRKKFPSVTGLGQIGRRLKVAERIRLNPRTTLYLIELDSRELLVIQSGDRVLQLDPKQSTALRPHPAEADHA